MPTLTVRAPSKRDRMALRHVRQRRVSLLAPWDPDADRPRRGSNEIKTTAMMMMASDMIVAAVDDEVCGFAIFERGDDSFAGICHGLEPDPRGLMRPMM